MIKNNVRLIICGTRSFNNYPFMSKILYKLTAKFEFKTLNVISGKNKFRIGYDKANWPIYCGADFLGEKWAHSNHVLVTLFDPKWYGKWPECGPKRNDAMIEYATEEGYLGYLVAFWDGESRGTEDCFSKARKAGMKVKVITYKDKA